MLIVQKFGGTSLGNIDLIRKAAKITASYYAVGYKIIVVVSAMAGITNNLISLTSDISSLNNHLKLAEYDNILSTGETVAASLFALALQEVNISAYSMQAWQARINTDQQATKALIKSIDIELLSTLVEQNIVPIVTGFQGINSNNRITTLGRGGSDTTAVAIAAALNSHCCEIYTDVEGVYTADPRLVHDAALIKELSYEEMLELAGMGAKVLHSRSVEVGRRYLVPIKIISSFTKITGTHIVHKPTILEEVNKVTGITYLRDLTKVHISQLKISLNAIIKAFASKNITLHQILQADEQNLIFTILLEQNLTLREFLGEFNKLYFDDFTVTESLSSVALIGAAIRHNMTLLSEVLNLLAVADIEILHIFNTEIKLSFLIKSQNTEQAVKLLHNNLLLHHTK